MNLYQEVETGAELAASVSEEKTLSVIDLIVNGGTGSIVIIMVLFVLLFAHRSGLMALIYVHSVECGTVPGKDILDLIAFF